MIRIRSVALACALAATLPAFAASSASASISNIQFQVIDLTPTDASVSGFSVADLTGALAYNLSDYSQASNESYGFSRKGLGTFAKTASGDIGTASATVSAGTNSLSVEGAAGGPATSYSASINGNSYYYGGSIKLSAQSVLIITADAVLKAAATNPVACTSTYGYCSSSEYATAAAWMNLSYNQWTPAGSISSTSNNNLNLNAQARGEYSYQTFTYDYSKYDWYNYPIVSSIVVPASEQTLSDSRQFYAVFTNTSDVEQTASFSIGVQINGGASTAPLALPGIPSPVPEPTSLALALAGLGLIGRVARRRAA